MRYADEAQYWTDAEVQDMGLDHKDGTLCRKKGCDCGWCVEDATGKKVGPTGRP